MEKCVVATIGLTGTIITTEIEMDGYLNGVGVILLNCYNKHKDVYDLIRVSGSVKRLDVNLEKTEFNDSKNKTFREVVDFYNYYNQKAYKYLYFFDGVKWMFVDFGVTKTFRYLTNQVIVEEREIYNKSFKV